MARAKTPRPPLLSSPRGRLDPRAYYKPPVFRGSIHIAFVDDRAYARKNPRPYGRPRSEKQKAAIDWFRATNQAWKYLPPRVKDGYKAAAIGALLQPRDLFFAHMAGRLFWLTTEEGIKMYPLGALEDLSETLDIIAQLPGSLIVRAELLWTSLPPGPAGYVLTSRGPGLTPEYQPIPTPPLAMTSNYLSPLMFTLSGSGVSRLILQYGAEVIQFTTTAVGYAAAHIPVPPAATRFSFTIYHSAITPGSGNIVWEFAIAPRSLNNPPGTFVTQTRTAPGPSGTALHQISPSEPFELPPNTTFITLRFRRYGDHPDDTFNQNSLIPLVTLTFLE